jgi:transcriptional regulator with XRE-family HTH domain
MATFGEKIKALRFHLGMSQEDMGKTLNTSKQNISRYENEQNSPRIDTVDYIAKKLGIEITFLINDEFSIQEVIDVFDRRCEHVQLHQIDKFHYTNPETQQIAQEISEDKNLRALFSAARDASPEDLKTAHEILKALKAKERGSEN